MNVELLVISILHTLSAVVILSFGFFVLFKKIKEMRNVVFFLLCVTVASFNVIFLIGANIADVDTAWNVWIYGTTVVFIGIFYAHFFLVYVVKEREKYMVPLVAIYVVGLSILVTVAIIPRFFIPHVEQKLYLLSYPVAGPLYFMIPVFILGVGVYVLVETIRKYRKTTDDMEKRRLEYFIIAALYGYTTGSTAFFLLYNIPISPIISPLNGTFIIPIAYGIIKHQVLDIRVVVKKAFVYSILITIASAFLVVLTLLNQWFLSVVPGLPLWIIPVITAFGSVFIGRLFWNKSQEFDLLRYEFITIAAHKLRTPLTEMKWEIENILLQKPEKSVLTNVHKLRNTNDRLIMLSDALVESSEVEESGYSYNYTPTQLPLLTDEILEQFDDLISKKKLSITVELDEEIPVVKVDPDRIKSVIRVLIENAIIYSNVGGQVLIHIEHKKGRVTFSVVDNGIGIGENEEPYIFSRFYRTGAAKVSDTEGIGIGLYLSKSIVERHGGKIGFTSEGEGMGSKFWFSIDV